MLGKREEERLLGFLKETAPFKPIIYFLKAGDLRTNKHIALNKSAAADDIQQAKDTLVKVFKARQGDLQKTGTDIRMEEEMRSRVVHKYGKEREREIETKKKKKKTRRKQEEEEDNSLITERR